jgi:hypothetical protein
VVAALPATDYSPALAQSFDGQAQLQKLLAEGGMPGGGCPQQ